MLIKWRMGEVQHFCCFANYPYYKEMDLKLEVQQTNVGSQDKNSRKVDKIEGASSTFKDVLNLFSK